MVRVAGVLKFNLAAAAIFGRACSTVQVAHKLRGALCMQIKTRRKWGTREKRHECEAKKKCTPNFVLVSFFYILLRAHSPFLRHSMDPDVTCGLLGVNPSAQVTVQAWLPYRVEEQSDE